MSYYVTTQGRDNVTLFLVDRNKTKKHWWTMSLTNAMVFNKHLTFHLSRHTFATLTMSKGVSLESVSKMLGHKNIQTTQIYAKMTTEKVGRDMAIFAESIKETERKFVVNF